MGKLEEISLADLHERLEDVDEKKPTQRLLLAILYKQGPSVPMIAEWFDMRERTVYDWFDAWNDNHSRRRSTTIHGRGGPRISLLSSEPISRRHLRRLRTSTVWKRRPGRRILLRRISSRSSISSTPAGTSSDY